MESEVNLTYTSFKKNTAGCPSTPDFSIASLSSGDCVNFCALSRLFHLLMTVTRLGSLASRKTWAESSPLAERKSDFESNIFVEYPFQLKFTN